MAKKRKKGSNQKHGLEMEKKLKQKKNKKTNIYCQLSILVLKAEAQLHL